MKRLFITAVAILLASVCSFARQPERGYRGFAEWTNRVYHTDGYWSKTHYVPGISTSHGYQFNPWLFAGIGIDYSLADSYFYSHHYDFTSYFLSVFADVRTDLQFGKLTPFADIRLGVNATSTGTVYFSPSIGYRFNWGRKVGINLGVGYTLDGYRYENWIWGTTPEGYNIAVPTGKYINWSQSSFTFRLGIDF